MKSLNERTKGCIVLTVLCLAALLGVLPVLTSIPAAPAPQRSKVPQIYALVYVGLGKNDPRNARRIKQALHELPDTCTARGASYEAKFNDLPIVKEKSITSRDRDNWVSSKTHVANLEGTSVVRVWFTDGSPEDQVFITNAIVRAYVKHEEKNCRFLLELALDHERQVRRHKRAAGLEFTEEDEKAGRRTRELLEHPPQVIEWAALPQKP